MRATPELDDGVTQGNHWRGFASEPWDFGFALFVLGHFLVFAGPLIVHDLILAYPFVSGDSHDWIANGLFLAGRDVFYTARPPLIPLVLAGLHRLGLLDVYPLLAQLLMHGTLLGLYGLLRQDYPRPLATGVAAAWLLNTRWLELSLPVMADLPAACLLFWSVFFWRRENQVWAGVFASLSALAQPIALLLVAPAALTVLCFRRQDLRSRSLWVGGLLLVGPTLAWWLVKRWVVGTSGDFTLRHWSLLVPHLDSVGFYAFAGVALVSPPAVIGIVLGVWSFLRRGRTKAWCFVVLAILATVYGFFVVLYDYNALRFLGYGYPLLAVLLAEGLHRLRWPGVRVVLLVLVLGWSIAPTPGRGGAPARIVLWPAPPVDLVASTSPRFDGSRRLDPFDVRLETRPISSLWRRHPLHRVWDAARQPTGERGVTPEQVHSAWAVYFYDDASQAGTGYGFVTRLGNLLHQRVLYLPSTVFDPAWRRLELERLGTLDGESVFEARIPGQDGSWLVLARAGGAAERRMLRGSELPPLDRRLIDADWLRAERLAPDLTGRSVAILAPEQGLEPWQTLLPFAIEVSRFLVTGPEQEDATRALLGAGQRSVLRDDCRLVEHSVFGQPWVVVEPGESVEPAEPVEADR